jgi:hypothetical protein
LGLSFDGYEVPQCLSAIDPEKAFDFKRCGLRTPGAHLLPVFVLLKQPGHASGYCVTNSPAATPIFAEAVGTRLINYRMERSKLHKSLVFEVKTGAIDS